MGSIDLERFKAACDYKTPVNVAGVEKQLGRYLAALKVDRKIVRLEAGWTLDQHPSLARSTSLILDDFQERTGRNKKPAAARDARAAIDARDALDARDARDARAALDASDAPHRFAAWCVQFGGWYWWRWELSWISTTHFGAKQLKKPDVTLWAEPLFEAFIAGAWFLYWTDDTLYWVAHPKVHVETVGRGTRRLHNEEYAAVESDCENLYFWHGTLVPAYVVVKPEWITLAEIKAETNAETRRVLRERYGEGRYLADTKAQVLDVDTVPVDSLAPTGACIKRALMEDDEGRRFLVGSDGSTPRCYFMEVPRETVNCDQAYRALHPGLSPDKCLLQA